MVDLFENPNKKKLNFGENQDIYNKLNIILIISREVQEMTGKLLETVSGIGGSMLEAGTWLRGTRTVKSHVEVTSANL